MTMDGIGWTGSDSDGFHLHLVCLRARRTGFSSLTSALMLASAYEPVIRRDSYVLKKE